MPSALYAISYQPTSSVIALCRLEKKPLVDQAAWDQLRAALVGQRLPISVSTSAPTVELALPVSNLGCDLVNDLSPLDLEPVLAEPLRYRVVAAPAGPTVPGDGKPKLLKDLGDKSAISEIRFDSESQLQVTVTLLKAPGTAGAWLVFEGHDPVRNDPPSPNVFPPPKEAVFTLPLGLKLAGGVSYTVMFLMEDTPVEVRRLVTSENPGFTRDSLDTPPPPVTPAPSPPARSAPVTPAPSPPPVTPGLSPPPATPGLVTPSEPRSNT